jgi:hypothetical protein
MRPIMLAMSGKSWQAPTGIIGAQLTAQPSDKNAPTYPGTVWSLDRSWGACNHADYTKRHSGVGGQLGSCMVVSSITRARGGASKCARTVLRGRHRQLSRAALLLQVGAGSRGQDTRCAQQIRQRLAAPTVVVRPHSTLQSPRHPVIRARARVRWSNQKSLLGNGSSCADDGRSSIPNWPPQCRSMCVLHDAPSTSTPPATGA